MDAHRFDALTRCLATPRSRRQFVRAVCGSLVAAFGALTGADRTAAATCADRCAHLLDAASRARCVAVCVAADQAGFEAVAARATATALRDCAGTGGQLCGGGSDIFCCAAGERCVRGQCEEQLGDPAAGCFGDLRCEQGSIDNYWRVEGSSCCQDRNGKCCNGGRFDIHGKCCCQGSDFTPAGLCEIYCGVEPTGACACGDGCPC